MTFQRPLTGALISVPVTVFFQNQTAFNVVATQPITQLLAVRQLAKIARADENIARAKAGMPVEAVSRQVEKNFFDLLVAEREMAAATANAEEPANGMGDGGRRPSARHGGTASRCAPRRNEQRRSSAAR